MTLAVTGLPHNSHSRRQQHPWSNPLCIAPEVDYGALSFEVSLLEALESNYLAPEDLNMWRISALEEIFRRVGHVDAKNVMIHYFEWVDGEDLKYVSYTGRIQTFIHWRAIRKTRSSETVLLPIRSPRQSTIESKARASSTSNTRDNTTQSTLIMEKRGTTRSIQDVSTMVENDDQGQSESCDEDDHDDSSVARSNRKRILAPMI